VLLAHPGWLPKLFPMQDLKDEKLMAQLQAGQADALAVLFDRYHRLVLGIALKIVRDRGEAEDVMQNVLLEIFRAAAQFDPAKIYFRVEYFNIFNHPMFAPPSANFNNYLQLPGFGEISRH
jgi:hypothetical protein